MTDELTLTVIDTRGIQDYIFGTNNLRQNIGASYLVDQVTRTWLRDALEDNNPGKLRHNILNFDATEVDQAFSPVSVVDSTADAEVIYAGGGNALVLFTNRDAAVARIRSLTARMLRDAPGLNLIVAHEPFDWRTEPLGSELDSDGNTKHIGVLGRAFRKIAERKDNRVASLPPLGLSVTAQCVFTGQPAVATDKDGRLISSESHAKLRSADAANASLEQRLLNEEQRRQFTFPADFDRLGGTKGESSYLAVIHTDGNDMAKRAKGIGAAFSQPNQNGDCVRALREFSVSIQRAAMTALQATANQLVDSVTAYEQTNEDGKVEPGKRINQSNVTLQAEEDKDGKRTGKFYLPFRPIVFGGDDVTFVCDGRLGVSLASYYLKTFASQTLSDNQPAHGRAGIAVVNTHYPFARAYELADELCKSAKEFIKQSGQPMTAVDWHFAVGGLVLSLGDVRKREYRGRNGDLVMRPAQLYPETSDWRSWQVVSELIEKFNSGDEWRDKRNKVMKLREVLREGVNAVQHFCKVYRVNLPQAEGLDAPDGWKDGRCTHFDAIEAMEFWVNIETESHKEGA